MSSQSIYLTRCLLGRLCHLSIYPLNKQLVARFRRNRISLLWSTKMCMAHHFLPEVDSQIQIREYQEDIFLISPQNHMLRVLHGRAPAFFHIFPRKHMLWYSLRSNSNIHVCCGYSLDAPHRGASNEYP